MSSPFILGVTGPIASGKSLVSQILNEKPIVRYISSDKLVTYQKGEEVTKAVISEFGVGLSGSKEELDRAALGKIVFADREKMARLESLVWPAVKTAVNSLVATYSADDKCEYVVLESAVLLDAGWDVPPSEGSGAGCSCDAVWVVRSDPEVAVQRMIRDRGMEEGDARGRLEAQRERKGLYGELEGVVGCPYTVITNGEGVEELRREVEREFRGLLGEE